MESTYSSWYREVRTQNIPLGHLEQTKEPEVEDEKYWLLHLQAAWLVWPVRPCVDACAWHGRHAEAFWAPLIGLYVPAGHAAQALALAKGL